MSITLLGNDETDLRLIESCLVTEQIAVESFKLDPAFFANSTEMAGTCFLILQEQDLIKAGELTKQVREVLGFNGKLVLCMPQPIRREALLDMGANEIITPAAKSHTDVAERLLGELILDGNVQPNQFGEMRGATGTMRALYGHIKIMAPLDGEPVLILGEKGTGKELVAQELHNQSARSNQEIVAVNVATFGEQLVESTLFGHRKGAFTDAKSDRKGLIEKARGGTIFLDEIGELELHLQAKLLRVLEQKQIFPVGSDDAVQVDVELSATRR